MPTPALLLSRNSFVGLGKETTQGTYVAPTVYFPGQSYKPQDKPTYDDDTSIQGNAAKLQAVIQGVKDSTFGLDFLNYYENIGNILVALGWADTIGVGRSVSDGVDNSTTTITSATAAFVAGDVGSTITGTDIPAGTTIASVTNGTTAVLSAAATGTGSARSWVIAGGTGTWNHKFKLASTQPPSYSITDYIQSAGIATRGYPGMMCAQADLTIDAKALVKVVTSWMGFPSASQSKPTPVYPALPASHGWQATHTFAGTSDPRLVSAGFTLKRAVSAEHTSQNSQNPYVVFSGEAECSAKIKGLFLDDTELNYVLNNTQPTWKTVLTSPSGSPAPVLTFTGTISAWKDLSTDRSGQYIQFDATADFVNSSTDGGPGQFLLANGVSTAY